MSRPTPGMEGRNGGVIILRTDGHVPARSSADADDACPSQKAVPPPGGQGMPDTQALHHSHERLWRDKESAGRGP